MVEVVRRFSINDLPERKEERDKQTLLQRHSDRQKNIIVLFLLFCLGGENHAVALPGYSSSAFFSFSLSPIRIARPSLLCY